MSKLLVCGVLMCLFAAILSIISTAIPYWLHVHGSFMGQEGAVDIGLWQTCVKYKTSLASGTKCGDTGIETSWWKAVKALMIIGNACLTFSTILGLLYCKFNTQNSAQGTIFMALFGGIVLTIAVIVFGSETKEDSSSFSVCFILAIVSAVLALLSAALVGKAKRGPTGYSSI